MEKIVFVSQKHGRKSRLGTVVSGLAFCCYAVPTKAEHVVYFGIPGAHEDFLQAHVVKWDGEDKSLPLAIEQAIDTLSRNDLDWCYSFSANTLEEVRAKQLKYHREYLFALLADHKTYTGEDWK